MRYDVDTSILLDILNYDAETGVLFWKKRPNKYFSDTTAHNKEGHAKWWNGRFAGKRACKSDCHRGYMRVSIFGEEYQAHRVIWAMVHGYWPTNSIDHIDGDKANNRIINLREATTAENNKNRAPHGKSQYRGVSWRTRQNCWVSAIKTDGKVSFLGCFKEEIEAAKAYDRAAIVQHGEFARTNFPKADYEARIRSAVEVAPSPRAQALEEAARHLLFDIDELVRESGGVYGLHLNGDEAPWVDLLEGGKYEEWMRSVEELRRALSSQPVADGWLPIETAPKDGTPVLVHFVPNEVPSLKPLICAAYWEKSDGLMKPGFWRVFHSVGPSFTATHWLTLPASPGASE